MLKRLALLAALFALSACSVLPSWMGADTEDTLKGERLSVLPDRKVLIADAALHEVAVQIPEPRLNTAWIQGQAVAEDGTSILRNAKLNGDLSKTAKISDGDAPDEDVRLTSGPIIVGDIVVMLDGQGRLFAYKLDKLNDPMWKLDLLHLAAKEKSASGEESRWASWFASKEDFIGGNIAFVEGAVIVATGDGHIFAVELVSGTVMWQRTMDVSIQSAPSGKHGTVYFVTSDNALYALSLKDGTTQWTHNGVPEQTKILGAPAPVPLTDMVIVPYSSGEIVALKQVNGLKLWEESLQSNRRFGALGFQFSDIMATPVAYAGRVFASAQGHLVALDVMNGNTLWDVPVTLSSTPWVAGEWLFGITTQDELVAIQVAQGQIKWVVPLPQYADPEDKKKRIRWSGPVLAEGKLILVGSHGELREFAADSGDALKTHEVGDNILLPPAVAQGKLFLFNNDADLSILE